MYPLLNPEQSLDATEASAYRQLEPLQALQLTAAEFRSLQGQLEFCARFHAYRNRPALALVYAALTRATGSLMPLDYNPQNDFLRGCMSDAPETADVPSSIWQRALPWLRGGDDRSLRPH